MGKLSDIALRAMDMYNQDFPTEESYFGEDHFKYMIAASYSKMLNDEYDKARLLNRQGTGFTFVELSPEWIKRYPLEFTEDNGRMTAALPEGVTFFSFQFDSMFSGIQGVYTNSGQVDFVKVSLNDLWQLRILPVSDKVFYFPEERKIIFPNLKEKLKGVFIGLIPNINENDDDFLIPESKELETINMTLQLMVAAKTGTVVQFLDNQNKNFILPQQVDSANATNNG